MTRRALIDAELTALAPSIPPAERRLVLDHALGSPGLGKAAPAKAAWLSLVAFVRHAFTDYDDMLDDGYDAASARHFCLPVMNAILKDWNCRRLIDGTGGDGDEGRDGDEKPPGDHRT